MKALIQKISKVNFKNAIAAALVIGMFASCEDDDNDSAINPKPGLFL